MAIIFNEGLPGSGKSYDACVRHALQAIKSGRKVFAYIKGLNHEKWAEVTGIPLPIVRMLLTQIEAEQVTEIHRHVENDSLVIIDELQNFFPSVRQPLSKEMTVFVTEHRHRGIDVVALGQDLRDCHATWKRRVKQKVTFTKLDTIGMEDRYTWTVYVAKVPEKFTKISSGQGKYEKKYFGLYKSHDDGTTNTANYKDKRANLFNTAGFKYALPAFAIAMIFAINFLLNFFDKGIAAKDTTPITVSKVAEPPVRPTQTATREPVPLKPLKPATLPAVPTKPEVADKEELFYSHPAEYFNYAAEMGRVRLSGLVTRENGTYFAYIDVLDATYHLKERFTDKELEALGWNIERHAYGLLATYKGKSHIIRMWPVDPTGRIANEYRTSGVLASSNARR